MELAAPGRKRPNGAIVPEDWLLLPLTLIIQFIFILLHEFKTGPGSGKELAQDELYTQQKFPLVNAFPLIPFCFGKLRKQRENGARQLLTYQNTANKCQEESGSACQMALSLYFYLYLVLYLCNDPFASPPQSGAKDCKGVDKFWIFWVHEGSGCIKYLRPVDRRFGDFFTVLRSLWNVSDDKVM